MCIISMKNCTATNTNLENSSLRDFCQLQKKYLFMKKKIFKYFKIYLVCALAINSMKNCTATNTNLKDSSLRDLCQLQKKYLFMKKKNLKYFYFYDIYSQNIWMNV